MVTGATGGIGAAIARRLADEGARVLVADIDTAEGERTARAIRDTGKGALFHPTDVSDEESWASALETAHRARPEAPTGGMLRERRVADLWAFHGGAGHMVR
ncbi:SDR family NAD(P)-dependent oxidoreductase [Streptomyces sp. S465]|uniref:SDR family NAD(P)-dependent oxidoreductase n=1 Tax=Streptomyces sp. S465 TaxID=2979468 RepID=UPI002E3673BC|nr:SDR family NAD(P)-dependent oxidoreductase [Streptomyces sp. S465]